MTAGRARRYRPDMSGKSRPVLYLVDGHSYIFRAFHGIRHLSTRGGAPTNAVYGVAKMLLRLLDDKDPSHVAVVLDAGGKNFRHEMYPEYKANRPPAPEDLKTQIPLVKEVIQALSLPLLQEQGCEADDVIASVCGQAVAEGFEVVIVSGDKDLMQLVSEGVVMYDSMKEVVYDPEGVQKKMGVPPEQVLDLLALMGDTSDNIPGVYGVGQKTASKLLLEHGDLETVLSAAPSMKKSKLKERLIDQADNARLSKKLASLATDVCTGNELEGFARKDHDKQALDELLTRLEFSGLRRQLVGRRTIDTGKYTTILTKKALGQVVTRIKKAKKCSVDLETTSLDPARANIVGISLATAEGDAVYIPVAHAGEDLPAQLSVAEALDALGPVLSDPAVLIYGQNIKYDMVVLLNRHGLEFGNIACDAMLASYVLDPGRASHGMDYLSREFLGHETITYPDVAGKGKNEIHFASVPIDRATAYSGEDADVTFRLCELLLPKVREAGLFDLFSEIELPLIHVLVDMELWGIKVDGDRLEAMSGELQREIEKLEERIHLLAGREFNINSPAQLRVVLFDELGFEVKKKTKSGASTDSTVLEELALEHELPTEILNYRSLTKLKSS